MLPDFSPTEWFSAASLSLSLSALLLGIFVENPTAKQRLLAACSMLAILSAGVAVLQSARSAAEIGDMAEQVVVALGNQEKTSEQLLVELGGPDRKTFALALDLLRKRQRIDSRIEQVQISKERTTAIRLWRALAADGPK